MSQVTWLFRRLHAHGLIAKIPRSRRWRVSPAGRRTMSTAIKLREVACPALFRRELTGATRRFGWPVTFSIGLATFRPPPPEVEVLLRETDGLLYEAKRSGKERVRHRVIAPPDPKAEAG